MKCPEHNLWMSHRNEFDEFGYLIYFCEQCDCCWKVDILPIKAHEMVFTKLKLRIMCEKEK